MHADTAHYLAYIATIDDPDAPLKALRRMSRSVKQKGSLLPRVQFCSWRATTTCSSPWFEESGPSAAFKPGT